MTKPRLIGLFACIALALFIMLTKPIANLAPQGHHILGVVMITLGLWIFRDSGLAYLAGGAVLVGGCLAFGLPLPVVVGGMASGAVWVLIPALFFGYVLIKTGLGKRIAYFVLKSFEPSYASVILSWTIIGVLLSMLTPSITVRIAIVMPIAMTLVEACKLEDRSRGSALINLAAWAGALLPGTGWKYGSLWGVFMDGFYPAEIKTIVTKDVWFDYMIVPWTLITILFAVGLFIFLKPKEPLQLHKDAFKEQYAALGPMSKQELQTLIILGGTLVLFSTEKMHGVPTVAVAMGAFLALMLCRVITFPEISTGINWDVVCFFGGAVSLTAILAKAGITAWLSPIIEPKILAFAGSPILLMVVILFGFWLIRFLDVPWGFSTIALTATLFIPLFQKHNIHPALLTVAVIAAGNCFFMSYQQPFITIAEAATKNRAWAPNHVTIGGVIFAVAVLISIFISTFYWKAMGLMA